MWLYCSGGLFNTINFVTGSDNLLKKLSIQTGNVSRKVADPERLFFSWILCPIFVRYGSPCSYSSLIALDFNNNKMIIHN